MSDLNRVIYSRNFTDENGELHYFNTGRDNVSGLSFPNHYVRNKNNYQYTRVLNIKLSPDTSLVYPIHECFLLTTYNSNNINGITNIVNLTAIVREGTIKRQDIKITCTPLNDISSDIHNIKVALKNELDATTGNTSVNLGIWLDSKDMIDIIIKDLSSLAYNEIPNNIYREFLQCEYEAHYLNNEDVIFEINMVSIEESIGTKLSEAKNIHKDLIDKLNYIDNNVITAVPDYKYLTVIYDDMYSINNVNVDEIVKPTAFQYVEVGNSFAKINGNYLQVNEAGNYIVALKVNMNIHEGMPTKMTMSLFLNDDRIEETTCSLYLNPANKVHPLGFLAGQLQIQLKPSDKLYLKARWTDKNNVFIENHCSLQITKLNTLK